MAFAVDAVNYSTFHVPMAVLTGIFFAPLSASVSQGKNQTVPPYLGDKTKNLTTWQRRCCRYLRSSPRVYDAGHNLD